MIYLYNNVSTDPRDMMSDSIGNHFQCQTELDKRSIQTITTCPGNQFLKAKGIQYVWRQCPRLRKVFWILPSDTLWCSEEFLVFTIIFPNSETAIQSWPCERNIWTWARRRRKEATLWNFLCLRKEHQPGWPGVKASRNIKCFLTLSFISRCHLSSLIYRWSLVVGTPVLNYSQCFAEYHSSAYSYIPPE